MPAFMPGFMQVEELTGRKGARANRNSARARFQSGRSKVAIITAGKPRRRFVAWACTGRKLTSASLAAVDANRAGLRPLGGKALLGPAPSS